MKTAVFVALATFMNTTPPPPAPYAALFVRLKCNDCHTVSALGVRASTDVAPDLTFAYADVVTRYGVNLESFLANPSGVMRLMLGAHIDLTVADRDSIVAVLKTLYQQRRADAGGARSSEKSPQHRLIMPS